MNFYTDCKVFVFRFLVETESPSWFSSLLIFNWNLQRKVSFWSLCDAVLAHYIIDFKLQSRSTSVLEKYSGTLLISWIFPHHLHLRNDPGHKLKPGVLFMFYFIRFSIRLFCVVKDCLFYSQIKEN